MFRLPVSPSTNASCRFAVLALLTVAFALPAAAQELKVAVIETEKILLDSNTGKSALAELNKLRESKSAEGEKLQTEIQGLRDQLTQGRLSLADDKIAELEQDLEEKTIALKRFSDDASRELNKRRDDVLSKIDQRVMPIIAAIGEEKGYSLIFRKFESGLVFASQEVDITAEVIQRLDAGSGG